MLLIHCLVRMKKPDIWRFHILFWIQFFICSLLLSRSDWMRLSDLSLWTTVSSGSDPKCLWWVIRYWSSFIWRNSVFDNRSRIFFLLLSISWTMRSLVQNCWWLSILWWAFCPSIPWLVHYPKISPKSTETEIFGPELDILHDQLPVVVETVGLLITLQIPLSSLSTIPAVLRSGLSWMIQFLCFSQSLISCFWASLFQWLNLCFPIPLFTFSFLDLVLLH